MSAREAVSKLVTSSLAPLLKESGFRKRGLTFERQRGDATQLVSVQISRDGASFYVHVGLIFDAVRALNAGESGMLIIGGHRVHFGARLEELVSGLPDAWQANDDKAGNQVRHALEEVLAKFDRIDGARAGLTELPLGSGFLKVLRAQLKWTTGDRIGAGADLEEVAREFSDRHACSVDELAQRAGLLVQRK